MKCREVKYWLYSFRPNTSWPAELVGHLQQCEKCQQLQAHLKQLDEQVGSLTASAAPSTGKQELLERIAHTPQSAAPTNGTRRSWLRWGGFFTAAAALFLFGWVLGQQHPPIETVKTVEVVREKIQPVEVFRDKIKTVEIFRDKIIFVNSAAERDLFASLVKRNGVLVRASQAKERLDTLLDMASDCRLHILKLIDQGPYDHLPLTINLYGKLLREGVLVQLQRVPGERRDDLVKAVRTRLEQLAELPETGKPLPKAIDNQQKGLHDATQDAIDLLDQPEAIAVSKPAKYQRSEPVHPTTALILFAITVSNEPDAVARAEFCAECIQQLTPCVLLNLADEAHPQRSELSEQFGELIRFGVFAPLAAVTAKNPSEAVSDRADSILQRATEAVEVMEKHVKQAPAAERKNVERILEATQKGWEKNWDKKGKGKGKDKKKFAP